MSENTELRRAVEELTKEIRDLIRLQEQQLRASQQQQNPAATATTVQTANLQLPGFDQEGQGEQGGGLQVTQELFDKLQEALQNRQQPDSGSKQFELGDDQDQDQGRDDRNQSSAGQQGQPLQPDQVYQQLLQAAQGQGQAVMAALQQSLQIQQQLATLYQQQSQQIMGLRQQMAAISQMLSGGGGGDAPVGRRAETSTRYGG